MYELIRDTYMADRFYVKDDRVLIYRTTQRGDWKCRGCTK